MELDTKRKLSIIFIIITTILLILGLVGTVLGVYLAVTYKTTLLWVSMAGILPASVVSGITSLIFDISYRKKKKDA